jgi:type I restriction enzyme M protein
MATESAAIVQRLCSYCDVLRNDGVSCGDYVEQLIARDKVNLDIFWLRDESLEETANLPEPDVLAVEMVMDLESALGQFRAIAEDLGE